MYIVHGIDFTLYKFQLWPLTMIYKILQVVIGQSIINVYFYSEKLNGDEPVNLTLNPRILTVELENITQTIWYRIG